MLMSVVNRLLVFIFFVIGEKEVIYDFFRNWNIFCCFIFKKDKFKMIFVFFLG